ncbi:MAG TPA: hypothetical protein VKF63_00425 [Terracidiphilus sp.]|nr:hypothetical protein [Terracidiphilus sp.]
MYKIAKEKFGFQLTFGNIISLEEMNLWLEESKKALAGAHKPFGVLIDMRTLRLLQFDVQKVMVEGQGLYKNSGMERSCVILASAILTMQFERLAKESGIYAFERYINSAAYPDWYAKAVGWIQNKIDPGL